MFTVGNHDVESQGPWHAAANADYLLPPPAALLRRNGGGLGRGPARATEAIPSSAVTSPFETCQKKVEKASWPRYKRWPAATFARSTRHKTCLPWRDEKGVGMMVPSIAGLLPIVLIRTEAESAPDVIRRGGQQFIQRGTWFGVGAVVLPKNLEGPQVMDVG